MYKNIKHHGNDIHINEHEDYTHIVMSISDTIYDWLIIRDEVTRNIKVNYYEGMSNPPIKTYEFSNYSSAYNYVIEMAKEIIENSTKEK